MRSNVVGGYRNGAGAREVVLTVAERPSGAVGTIFRVMMAVVSWVSGSTSCGTSFGLLRTSSGFVKLCQASSTSFRRYKNVATVVEELRWRSNSRSR